MLENGCAFHAAFAAGNKKVDDSAELGVYRNNWYMLRTYCSRFQGASASDWFNLGQQLHNDVGIATDCQNQLWNALGPDQYFGLQSGYRRETVHDLFGRLPVKTRAYVRTLMILPQETGEASGYAYTMNQDIVIYGKDIANLMVYIHESGHALDLGGAYTNDGSYLSSSDDWLKYYNQDSKVVDGYAKTNQLENVAQNHIVSSYNLNVPGGFGAFKSGWEQISHQYTLLDQRQHTKTAGDKLRPGYACGKRVKNDEIIRFPSTWTSRIMKKSAEGEKPNVELMSGLE
ncbi:MAG: hypothetical protein Q9194_005899, partial [Teloschistes cf. exilis]